MVARPGPARYAFTGAFGMDGSRHCLKNRLVGAYFDSKPPWLQGVAAQGHHRGRGKNMSDIVTAGILVIGDEILSGRTKDKNIGFIAEYLTNIGIDLKEVRVVADDEAEIIAALDALRHRYTYVFTTGGIGPTHDDITADSIAKAFGVGIDHDPRAVELLQQRFGGAALNEARLRMA